MRAQPAYVNNGKRGVSLAVKFNTFQLLKNATRSEKWSTHPAHVPLENNGFVGDTFLVMKLCHLTLRLVRRGVKLISTIFHFGDLLLFFLFFSMLLQFLLRKWSHSFIHSFKKAPLWSRWPSFRFWRDCGSFSLWISYFTPFAFRAYWKVFFFSYITLASVFSNQPSLIKVSVVIALCSAFTLNPNKNQSILIFMLKSCVLSQLGCVK